MNSPIIDKIINADPDTYIVFFEYTCSYCKNAIHLLQQKNRKFKAYNLEKIGVKNLLRLFNNHKELIGFDPNYLTKPLIFINGKFLGGYDDLTKIISPNL